jgi:regulator of sirC expression with transglutaminase-like and TPR domain
MIKLNPYMPDAYFCSAVANYNLHHADIAEEHAREAAKIDANHRNPKINHLLGVILAEKQDYKGAAENMRLYLQLNPNASDALVVKQQLGEIEKQIGTSATAQP